MSQIILTSSIAHTGEHIAKSLDKRTSEYKLLFIDTAAETEKGSKQWLKNDRDGLVKGGFQIQDFSITGKTKGEVEEAINSVDIVFVNGGNTFYLLDKMRKVGFENLIKAYLKKGGIYASSSAGSIVAGPNIEPARKLEDLNEHLSSIPTKGLNLVDFVMMPHWGSDSFKRKYSDGFLKTSYTKDYPILFLSDYRYIYIKDGMMEIIEVVET